MAELLAIISKVAFEGGGSIAALGDVVDTDRYTSANKALKSLAEPGSRLWLVTARPNDQLWLVGVLVAPVHDGQQWIAPAKSTVPITDLTPLRARIKFATGKGIAPGALGAALQTPRALAPEDIALFEQAMAGVSTSSDEPVQLRRVDDRDSLAHRIEVAKSGRAKCATCEQTLVKGVVRLAEVYQHGDLREPIFRFHHIPCAATAVPLVLRSALRTADAALVPDREALAAQIDARVAELASTQRARYVAEAAPEAPVGDSVATTALIEQVAKDPEDAGALAVLADELVKQDDPRGELITIMLRIAAEAERTKATAKLVTERAEVGELVKRRDELLAILAPRLDATDRAIWGIGFVRRLELRAKTARRLDEMAGLWRHPSLALVRELRLEFSGGREGPEAMPGLIEHAPKTFTRLEIGHEFDYSLGDVVTFVHRQAGLRALALGGKCDLGALAVPTLVELALIGNAYDRNGAAFARQIEQIDPTRLPNVRALSLTGTAGGDIYTEHAAILDALASRGWLAPGRLDTLTLAKLELDAAAAAALAAGKKQKLARLDIATCRVTATARPDFAALCTDLVFPAGAIMKAAAEATHCEHTGKPEWGKGKIISRRDGKLEIKFGKAVGTKVFKADAPFLKLS